MTRPNRTGPGPRFNLEGCVEETLPVAEPLEELEKVPLWAIAAVSKPGGRHQPKWKRIQTWDHPRFFPGSVYTGDSDYSQVDTSGTARSKRRHEKKVSAKKAVADGNLKNDEYRFWRGHIPQADPESVCRWCSAALYTPMQRADHFRLKHCNSKLIVVYRLGLKSEPPKCFACKKSTYKKYWGVPLCANAGCLARWKFSPVFQLEGFMFAKLLAKNAGYLDSFPDEKVERGTT